MLSCAITLTIIGIEAAVAGDVGSGVAAGCWSAYAVVLCAQVLGNAELRARYDAHGAEALNVDFMDSAEFFTALFGSDRRA